MMLYIFLISTMLLLLDVIIRKKERESTAKFRAFNLDNVYWILYW